jgi:hypothetical protein
MKRFSLLILIVTAVLAAGCAGNTGNPLVLEQKRDIGTLSEGLRHPRLPQRS